MTKALASIDTKEKRVRFGSTKHVKGGLYPSGFCPFLNAVCGFRPRFSAFAEICMRKAVSRFSPFLQSSSRFFYAVFDFCSILNAASGILECGVRFWNDCKTIAFHP